MKITLQINRFDELISFVSLFIAWGEGTSILDISVNNEQNNPIFHNKLIDIHKSSKCNKDSCFSFYFSGFGSSDYFPYKVS